MTAKDKKYIAEIARVEKVIETYSFQRNGVALYKVTAYSELLQLAKTEKNSTEISKIYKQLLNCK